ncbi:hypothetical protein VTO42DRAFT_3640 [Malbranchea cinnamomea]
MVAGMPEHGSLTSLDSSKSFKKWRGKLFSQDKDNHNKLSRDEQVDDFLASARPSPQPAPNSLSQPQFVSHGDSHASTFSQPRSTASRLAVPQAPRLDVSVSRQWPDSNELSPSASPTVLRPDFPESSEHHSPPPPATSTAPGSTKKRLRAKGLRVAFSNKAPEIIGEGGDDADIPTKDMIAVYRARSNSSASAFSDAGSESFSPQSPRRTATGFTPPSLVIQHSSGSDSNADQSWRPPLIHNAQDADFLLSISSNTRGSRLSLREDNDPNSLARRVQAHMRAEEGRALQNRKGATEADSESDEPQSPISQPPSNNPAPLKPSQSGDSSSGLSFWSNVLTSLPKQNDGNSDTRPENRPANPSPTPPLTAFKQSPSPPHSQSRSSGLPSHVREKSDSSYRGHRSQGSKDSFTSKPTLRSLANVVGDNAVTAFAAYVAQYEEVFSISAEERKASKETSLSEWVRASAWWFLNGRAELESTMRSARSAAGGSTPQSPSTDSLQQSTVNLAKAWWINQRIVPRHPELHRFGNVSTDTMATLARTAGDRRTAELLGYHQSIVSNLRALAMSMKRNNILPSEDSAHVAFSGGVDTSVWVKYPSFSPDVCAVLSGMASRSMLVESTVKVPNVAEIMPIKDTETHFCYGRMFVDAYISSGDDDSQKYAIPCMLSITRDRTAWGVIAAITSQSELVNIVIQSDRKQGPKWADVTWHVRSCSMTVRLPRGFELDVKFNQPDFKTLWKIVEYTHKVEESLEPEPGEKPIFEDILQVFQYFDKTSSGAFPAEPSPRCRIRLFERTVQITEGTGSRESHRGFRVVAVTSPKVKTLSSVCHVLGHEAPIVFGYLRGDDGSPALMIKVEEKGARYSMLMTFHDAEQRARIHSLLMGVIPAMDEVKLVKDLPLRSYSMVPVGHQATGSQESAPIQFSASSATVINTNPAQGHPKTILSERLRVFVNSSWGSVTDRINLGPGELKVSLDVNTPTAISIIRPGQLDLGVAIAENLVPKELPGNVTNFMKAVTTQPMIRRFNFMSLEDLHKFQHAITGFRVLFDGFASMFAIARRRMVVPIYKKWETNKARIQIIEQEKVVQLMAFLDDFSHGKAMNFVLKSTDVFENVGRSGKFGVKIVDAKFALPKNSGEEDAEFVCLDMPEYPGEHDDITIGFDTEKDRSNFLQAVPGSVREPSRMGSLRK